MSVLLLNMPFAQLCWPNLGLSLLKSALTSRGISCDLENPCFMLAERVGLDSYDWVAAHLAFVLGGEHLFAKEYFDRVKPLLDNTPTKLIKSDQDMYDELNLKYGGL